MAAAAAAISSISSVNRAAQYKKNTSQQMNTIQYNTKQTKKVKKKENKNETKAKECITKEHKKIR